MNGKYIVVFQLLLSAKSLADSQTIIFTCFCLDTKATKSQGQDHRSLRGQPNSMTFKKYVINAIS